MREDNAPQSEGIKIIVPSSLENLSLIRALARTYLVSKAVSEKDIFKLLTVIDELSTNAIEHGYNYHSGEISIFMIKIGDYVQFSVEDFGAGFDNSKESKDEGGMGLSIVKGLVDSLEIEIKEKGTKFEILKKVKEDTNNEL